MKLEELDIVYPLRPTKNGCEELRYSLRTVEKNLPHRNVYVYTPKDIGWFSDKVHVEIVEELPGPNASVNNKLLRACSNPKISDPFIFMNDDFFIMKKMEKLPMYFLGTLDEQIASRAKTDLFRKCLVEERDYVLLDYMFISHVWDFEAHAPILFHKQELKDVITRHPNSLRRSLYVAEAQYHLKAEEQLFCKLEQDCKLYSNFQWPYKGEPITLEQAIREDWPIISTTNHYWDAKFSGYIKPLYNQASIYERAQ